MTVKKFEEECFAGWEIFANFAAQLSRIAIIAPITRIITTNHIPLPTQMIIVQVKEGENIERALKKFKRKFEKTGIVKELRSRQAFQKPSVVNRKKMMKAVYVQQLRSVEE